MDRLIVDFATQGDRAIFALRLSTIEQLKRTYKGVNPIERVILSLEVEHSLLPYKKMIIEHILPLLTDLPYNVLQSIPEISIIDRGKQKEYLHIINQNVETI